MYILIFSLIILNSKNQQLKNIQFCDSTAWGPWTSGSYNGYQPGDFHWGNGQKISPNMWRLGQPDEFGPGKESCVYIYDGALYDESCTEKNNVICEQVPLQPPPPPHQQFFTFSSLG